MRKLIPALVMLAGAQGLFVEGALAAPSRDSSASGVPGSAIVATALRYLGYPYTTVGNSPATGFSCIGFVSYVYQSNGIALPDDLWGAQSYAAPVAFSNLMPGDVLYFGNTVWPGLSHTAIYLGGGRFVHAEWYNRGVVTSSFTNDPVDGDYWMNKYIGANRPWGAIASALPRSPLAAAPPPAPPVAVQPARPILRPGPRATVQVSTLNVRIRPSLFGGIRRLATQGTSLVVLQQFREWDWVELPDSTYGWVTSAGLGVSGETTIQDDVAAHPPLLSSVRVDGLRVHLRPNSHSRTVSIGYQGQRLLVLQGWNQWLRVLMPHGVRGWVDGAYVDLAGGQRGTAARHARARHAWARHAPARHVSARHTWARRAFASRTRRAAHRHARSGGPTVAASVRLRVRPGLHAGVIGLAPAGTHVAVLGSWRSWKYVQSRQGWAGWVYGAYITH